MSRYLMTESEKRIEDMVFQVFADRGEMPPRGVIRQIRNGGQRCSWISRVFDDDPLLIWLIGSVLFTVTMIVLRVTVIS